MTNPGWPFWSFSKRFSKFCLFTLQVNPSNLYRAEFDILFPFLPFVLFLRLCVHSCVCECIHRGIPYFDYPTSPTEANCPSHCTTSATGHRARKRFQRNPMEDSAPLCRFWRLAGCGVLPCLAVSIRTKHGYKWRVYTAVVPEEVFSSISNCESGTDGQGAIVKFRSIDEKPVRIRYSFLDFLLISFICY
jgi:hypothetical protein